jgi:hypothetical protein
MTTTVNLKTEALKNGVIWGVINVALFLLFWYVMPDIMNTFWHTGITLIIGLSLAVFFTLDMRKKAGGYWSFSEALWNIFVMFLLSMGIAYVFSILFGKFIDTNYPVVMKETVMSSTVSMYKSIGMDEDAINKAMEKVGPGLDKQFNPTFFQAIVGFGIAAVAYFVGALIFALIFKRSNPNPFAPVEDEAVTQ